MLRDTDGLYLGFDVSGDKKSMISTASKWRSTSGNFTPYSTKTTTSSSFCNRTALCRFCTDITAFTENFSLTTRFPPAGYSYGRHTTPNDNTDEDDGYFLELYIPYALFNKYTVGGVGEDTRLGITFGLWRASAEYNTTSDWGTDPNKDWDGWSYGEFCDPLYPETYAVLMSDGRIMTRDALVDEIGEPSDPSVDGKLTEAYWKKAAALNIPKTEDADGVKGLVYRDAEGLRVAFLATPVN